MSGDGRKPRTPSVAASGWAFRHPGRLAWALRDVSFTVDQGSLTILMGASGSGKSTLLAALAGLLDAGATQGSLEVTGQVGLVSQDPSSNIVMERVGDDVAFGLENHAFPPDSIWPRVIESLTDVGLAVDLNRSTDALSGGQQQLLALAAAIAPGPQILLLDEPTANLDPGAAAEVVAAVLKVRQETGATVILVEHRIAPWLAQADQVLLVADGGVESLSPEQLPHLLATRRGLAQQVWLKPADTHAPPRRDPGEAVLIAHDVRVQGRLGQPSSLEVRDGEVVALTGPPGSGKSTLLACLSGLLSPDSGQVSVDGRDEVWRWPSAQIAATFGVVFQNPEHQFLTTTVESELAHGLSVAGVSQSEAAVRVSEMLARLGLSSLARANPFTLSGGEQRRLSVGTALICRPRVLVLDEPTFGQDPATWAQTVSIISEHRDAGGAVILATHDPDLVAALGARVVELSSQEAHEAPRPGPSLKQRGLRSVNPLVLLICAVVVSILGLLSASVPANLALAAGSLAAGFLGSVPRRRLGLLAVPALVAAFSVAFSNVLLAPGGFMEQANWVAAALPATRVLAVALPGLIAAVSLDPTGLADALTVWLKVPARAAYAVLAGLRLLPLLSAEWVTLGQASRARGVAGRGIRARAGEFLGMSFGLLVAALRRGTRLALALDARGLTAGGSRSVARPPRLQLADAVSLAAVAVVLALLLTRG